MQKVYQRINWENEPSTKSPINDDNLNKMDYAIDQIDSRVVQLSGYEERVSQSEKNAKTSETNAKTSETNAKTSETNAKTSEINAKESEVKAKEYKEQAFSGTPEGYEALVEEVHRMDIAKSNGYSYPNTKKGGLRLLELVGSTVQNGEPSQNNPIAIENTFDCVEMEQGHYNNSTSSSGFGNKVVSTYSVRTKNAIPCSVGDSITIETENVYPTIRIMYFLGNKAISTEKVSDVNKATFVVPSGVDNFAFHIAKANTETVTPQTVGKISLTVNGKYVVQIVKHKKNFFNPMLCTNQFVSSSLNISSDSAYRLSEKFPIGQYVVSWVTTSSYVYIVYFDENKAVKRRVVITASNGSAKVQAQEGECYFSFMYTADGTSNVQIEKDTEVATEYEPYTEKGTTFFLDEPLREGDRLVKMDGVWYVERNRTTRVFDGTENWIVNQSGSYKYFYFNEWDVEVLTGNKDKCTHFIRTSISSGNSSTGFWTYLATSENARRFVLRPENANDMTTSDLKAWLSEQYANGTPVILEIGLKTPTLTPLDAQSQIALNSLETFDTITYLEVDSKIKPSGIEVEYGTSKVGALSLENANLRDNLNFTCAKYNVANNLSTTKEGFVLDARMGKNLQDQIFQTNSDLDEKVRWKWLGDFYGENGISVASVKDIATEFLVIASFAGSTGGGIVMLRNHLLNSKRLSEWVSMDSYYYSPSYSACVAHIFDYNNKTINLYPAWTKLVGTQNEMTSIMSLVWYR